jgi:hypothetical protein
MIIGMFLMILGVLLLYRNREIAIMMGRDPSTNHWGFMSSVVRQNIAFLGTVLIVGGLVFFVLF